MSAGDRYHKTFPVSWEQLHRDCRALAWRLVALRPWTRIIAVARGGLVPAAIIARELDIRLVDTVCISSYTLRTQGEPAILKQAQCLDREEETLLIVDDLVDTGRTAKVVRDLFPRAHFAAVYAKPEGRPLVDSYITEVSQDTWILFPWDSTCAFCTPIVDQDR